MSTWKKTIININFNLRNTIKNLNKSGFKICMIKDDKNNFVGTITDGDIRRGLLKGMSLSDKINKIINKKSNYVDSYCSNLKANQIMRKKKLVHLPIVENKIIKGMHYISTKSKIPKNINNSFVIMAGGKGERLRPITNKTPKPMIKINGKPMMEHIIVKARDEGFENFVILVHYLKNKIKNYFRDGKKLGVKIKYIEENKPLGTAGGISLLDKEVTKNFILSNSDVLSNFRYKDLFDYHNKKNAFFTMAVKEIEVKESYGLVKLKGDEIVGFREKPISKKLINCGVYSLNKSVIKYIIKNKEIDMISLLKKINKNNKITAFPVYESWRDLSLKKFLNRNLKI